VPLKRRSLTDPARYAQQVLALVESWGVDRNAVLREAGFEPVAFARAGGGDRLTLDEAARLFNAARNLGGRSDIGFEFGLQLKPTSHGLLGYGLIGCADVEAMWRLAARQQYHLTEAFVLTFRRSAVGGQATFSPIVAMPVDRLRFNLEVLAVSVHMALRMLLGDRQPACDIRLSMPAPEHRARYLALIPSRFHFDAGAAPGVVVAMDNALLAMPLPMSAPDMVAGVERHLNNLAPGGGADAAWAAVVAQMLRSVEGRQLTLKSVATQLGVSERTVDRRLAQEGVRFGSLCEDVMFERARALLSDGSTSVAQAAQRLGYRDAANFSRAFRRREGISPSDYQRRIAGTGPVQEAGTMAPDAD
jgi:AraC-like DNA-binding protein